MKRSSFTMIMAALVSLFVLSSCEKEPAELIVGKWNMTAASISYGSISMDIDPSEAGMAVTYTFNADGTGTTSESGAEVSEEMTFSYMVLTGGDKQILSITLDGETVNFDILTLDEDTLVIFKEQVQDGQTAKMTMTFTRA